MYKFFVLGLLALVPPAFADDTAQPIPAPQPPTGAPVVAVLMVEGLSANYSNANLCDNEAAKAVKAKYRSVCLHLN